MAKTRGKKKKTAPKAPARRARRPKPAARAVKPAQLDRIELRPFRTALTSHVQTLSDAIGRSAAPQPELEDALKRMSRWLADIQEICGPDMMIPVP